MTFECTGKGSLSLRAMRALKGRRMDREGDPVASIGEGLEIFAGAITEAAFGSESPQTAIRLNNLGFTLSSLGRTTEALPVQQRALAIAEAAYGPDHPQTAAPLHNLGIALRSQERPADALPRQARALAIREAALGPGTPQ